MSQKDIERPVLESLVERCAETPEHEQIADSIRVRYQPIIRFSDMRPVSVEVLARTMTDEGVIGGPEPLVDAMTGSDVSISLTGSILERALIEFEEFGFHDLDLEFAVNLPLDAMMHPQLVPIIEGIRIAGRVPAKSIRFELTERHPVEDIAHLRGVIQTLLDAGYGVALDDITPSMPNLNALMKLNLRAVKLDRSVVISGADEDYEFIDAVVAQARISGHDVIAEGIETAETLNAMRAHGVGFGQGYLFARPVAAPVLRQFLSRWTQSEPPGGIVA